MKSAFDAMERQRTRHAHRSVVLVVYGDLSAPACALARKAEPARRERPSQARSSRRTASGGTTGARPWQRVSIFRSRLRPPPSTACGPWSRAAAHLQDRQRVAVALKHGTLVANSLPAPPQAQPSTRASCAGRSVEPAPVAQALVGDEAQEALIPVGNRKLPMSAVTEDLQRHGHGLQLASMQTSCSTRVMTAVT